MFDFKKINIEADRPYWVAFNTFQGIGPIRFLVILKAFGSAEAAWKGSRQGWKSLNLGDSLEERFFRYRQDFYPLVYFEKLISGGLEKKEEKWGFNNQEQKENFFWVERQGRYLLSNPGPIWPLTLMDEDYPFLLKDIDSSPFVLYVKSDLSKAALKKFFSFPSLAVVGTRKMTGYGRQATAQLVRDLAQAGLVIVSGMARGVDSAAHQAALEAGGRTVAVLGCGADIIYPPENKKLYQLILRKGVVISEFPPGMPPLPGNFPSRNRIIAGMSFGVLVSEGARKSGSLITASLAAEFGREVFAVPGPINFGLSAGPMFLIKNGAKLVSEAEDILEELDRGRLTTSAIVPKGVAEKVNLSGEEKLVVDSLQNENLTVDEIIEKTEIVIDKLNSLLTVLEIKGIIENLGGGRWGRR
ncbi:DNA-protecting protein DprA [Candidatus Shapirobacteria bacterium CG09_land_8_20_14_0_10_38_17]|uniref:DNA-protecting protein DprA n=1 Tax=Candidatus Shapirobacteria bacterium CG09_land_8_20_14_0_10_38_17 TaxID=1974884 RepID=A0A2H0WR88_9BACT|nr:MAG: DNA-protecting protein DprA [Candidatus Shapirobacteria bacterium CG09_land_8_20_14_0_10_38_17]